ncbi:LOW QUALITY PROTEIN: T-cell surface glycoprotein CD4 [Fundulus heteroclitus]|uniref:LOW QUALITY PROTEIN: T-cell surface glycoprotein CD4 n=1 Tax=Fundulus heteroclitus TaxID=8078 RepID=UPI00165B9575|nr:LOW QUALITY PROTEIN: T-cell surface glycoprotein CD4 [Fundulus heteroclitus]
MRKVLQFFVFLIIVFKTNGADKVIYVQVGDNVELQLSDRCDNYYVSWFFGREDGLDLADMNYLGRKHVKHDDVWKDKLSLSDQSSLIIKNIEENNFGTFVCRVSDSKKVCLKPTFHLFKVSVSMEETSPVIPGDSLTLSCNVETQRKPSVFWMNPMGQSDYTDRRVQKRAGTRDNGEWACVVEDNGKKSRFKLPVSVVGELLDFVSSPLFSILDFSSTSEHLFTSTNFPLTVPFLITPNAFVQQIPTKIKRVQWFFIPQTSSDRQSIFSISPKNEPQEENSRGLNYENFTKGGNFSLYRKPSSVDDRGNYTCSITFTNGFTISRTVLVEVLQIIPSPGTDLISGQSLNLSCSTGGPLDPDVQVNWFPPKTSSLAKDELRSSHLMIPRVGTEDSGSWRCELRRSGATLTSAVITLKIEPILTVWMMVTICAAAVILILLLALAFTLFRRRQRKMRHLRHRLCKCETPKPKGFYKA